MCRNVEALQEPGLRSRRSESRRQALSLHFITTELCDIETTCRCRRAEASFCFLGYIKGGQASRASGESRNLALSTSFVVSWADHTEIRDQADHLIMSHELGSWQMPHVTKVTVRARSFLVITRLWLFWIYVHRWPRTCMSMYSR
jgi:hypothetical protein